MPLARLRLSTVGEDEEEVASTTDGGIEKVWIKTDAMIFFGRWSELIYEENGLRVWVKTEVFCASPGQVIVISSWVGIPIQTGLSQHKSRNEDLETCQIA